MEGLQRDNNKNRYTLTLIDVFSNFAWFVPVKQKDGKSICDAFELVLRSANPCKPEQLQTDKEKKFFNRVFTCLIFTDGFHHFEYESDQKAAVVKRFNRTLETKIWT